MSQTGTATVPPETTRRDPTCNVRRSVCTGSVDGGVGGVVGVVFGGTVVGGGVGFLPSSQPGLRAAHLRIGVPARGPRTPARHVHTGVWRVPTGTCYHSPWVLLDTGIGNCDDESIPAMNVS